MMENEKVTKEMEGEFSNFLTVKNMMGNLRMEISMGTEYSIIKEGKNIFVDLKINYCMAMVC